MKKYIYTILFTASFLITKAQYISITSQAAVHSEDFNTLSTSGTLQTTLPSGWWISEAPGNFSYRAGDGSANSGDTYSYGTGTNSDRAFGALASGSVTPNFGVRYINNSGSSFTSFYFNLTMEQWRSGGRTGLDSLYFFYAVNNNLDSNGFVKINTGTWVRQTSCDLTSKVTQGTASALDGNAAANNQYYGFNVTGLTVNVGDTLYLRWRDPNVSGSDDGLSIDNYNFSVTTSVPVTWKSFTANKNTDATLLKWSTSSEKNNNYFDVQRSIDGKTFESITKIKGVGTSNKVNYYQFNDNQPLSAKTVYYRLKQVDIDGKYSYTKTLTVSNSINQNGITAITPNPFANELSVSFISNQNTTATVQIIDMIGKAQLTFNQVVNLGTNTVDLNTAYLHDGIYFVRVNINGETFIQRVIKK